jgi:hypothetical protein
LLFLRAHPLLFARQARVPQLGKHNRAMPPHSTIFLKAALSTPDSFP